MSEFTRSVLKKYWGYDAFRPYQEDIVDAVVGGRDTLALLPTGGGKSICFQVPAMSMEGICIVVTPLIALMKDQVANLVKKGIAAAAIYSGMHASEVELVYNQAVFGRLKFLYVSPERLQTVQFLEALKRMRVCLLSVDESHCISQWGYDFRPPYLKIADIRLYIPATPVLALTATATAKVVDDIQFRLGFKQKNVFQSSFERKNVTYNVCHEADKYGFMQRKLKAMTSGSAIVYVRNRKKTRVISDWLNAVGVSATFYHAGLEAKVRDERQDLWMRGKVRVIVATNAFGMGIDKPDVRLVIHIDLPDSIEAYFQEAGRAGRDLQPAEAFLLVAQPDIQKLQEDLRQSFPDMGRIKLIYSALGNYFNIPVGAGQNTAYPFVLADFVSRYGFSMLEVFHTLKILEKEGFFVLSEAFDEPSRLMVLASRDELYAFQVANPQFDALTKCLLRSFPGVMTDYVKFDEESLARRMNVPLESLQSQLKRLNEYHFLSYIPRNEKPQIFFLQEFVDTRHFSLSNEHYADRKNDAEARVKAVIGFVNNDVECRSVQLLRYFNEETKKQCGRCDVCLNRGHGRRIAEQYVQVEEKIKSVACESPISMQNALDLCNGIPDNKVLEYIRLLIDDGILSIDNEGNLKAR